MRLLGVRCEGERVRLLIVVEEDDGRALGVRGGFAVAEDREGLELGGGGLRFDEAISCT